MELKELLEFGPAMAKANVQTTVWNTLAEVVPSALQKISAGQGEDAMTPAEMLVLSLVVGK